MKNGAWAAFFSSFFSFAPGFFFLSAPGVFSFPPGFFSTKEKGRGVWAIVIGCRRIEIERERVFVWLGKVGKWRTMGQERTR